ncbi:MAG: class I SAM-dependent methyltransferase [Gammaproteobacteria bacterium]
MNSEHFLTVIVLMVVTTALLTWIRWRYGRPESKVAFVVLFPFCAVLLAATGGFSWLTSSVIAGLGVGIGGLIALAIRKIAHHKTLYPLFPRRYNFDKRRDTLRKTLALLEERGAKTLVETGVARRGLVGTRGDGASTVVFGLWAKQHDARLDSVDIDPQAINMAAGALQDLGLNESVGLHTSDSVVFLEHYTQPVDFLYLDSYDYDLADAEVQSASQAHHLKEFQMIEPKLHENTVVLIDDCKLPGGGKGKSVIAYMQERDWKIVLDDYQVLLTRNS